MFDFTSYVLINGCDNTAFDWAFARKREQYQWDADIENLDYKNILVKYSILLRKIKIVLVQIFFGCTKKREIEKRKK